MVGTVVIVEVPFDATDPSAPERNPRNARACRGRECDSLLVRPIYPRTPDEERLQAWRRLGLDHVCYVDDTRVALSVAPSESLGVWSTDGSGVEQPTLSWRTSRTAGESKTRPRSERRSNRCATLDEEQSFVE